MEPPIVQTTVYKTFKQLSVFGLGIKNHLFLTPRCCTLNINNGSGSIY